MIRFLSHSEINRTNWDACIAGSLNSTVYPYSWYLDRVSPGWDALVEGDYESVMPLTANKKYGITYLYQPFFTQQLGVFSAGKLSPAKVNGFLSGLPEKFRFIEINLNAGNEPDEGLFSYKKNHTYCLSLQPSYETIYKNYSENTRRNIKKSIKHGLVLKTDTNPKKILQLFRNNRGKQIKTLGTKQYDSLESLIRDLAKIGHARILSSESRDQQLCAGAFFVEAPGHSIFLFSGSGPASRENGAMFFLIDRYIAENAGNPRVLDFNGSNNPDLARFYSGFGAGQQSYITARKNSLPGVIKWIKN
jgi:hypothetical protein